MTRTEVLQKINEARRAIKSFKEEGLEKTASAFENDQVQMIRASSVLLLSEARTIGAAGQTCPTCGGSGRT
jgi:hypothetical protein